MENGELIEWDDERGFGFIHDPRGGRLFIHISALDGPRRPVPGDRLRFVRGTGRDGRPAAVQAALADSFGRRAQPEAVPSPVIEQAQQARALRIAAAALLLLMVLLLPALGRAPDWLILPYLGMGAISAFAYGLDKRAARAGRWRVAESTLHLLDVAGGIIGGLLAQAALHHKTAKTGFATATAAIVLIHLALFGALASGWGEVVPR